MNDDDALLRSYAEEGSEDAFTALVRRHVDFVYAAALRRVGDESHLAADIAQTVFTTLARQARRRWRPTVLAAWLHTATRNAALNAVIAEQRRRTREQVALDPAFIPGRADPDWDRLQPVLDAAIDELNEPDRIAVVLRCLQQRPFAEIGEALKISADGARMRTERALEKLRTVLAKRGITSTAAAVGTVISSQPAVSAPAGLAASIATASFAGGGTGLGASGLAAVFASLMKLKTFTTAAAVLFAFGAGAYVGLMQHLDAPPLPTPEAPRHSQVIADLRKENLTLRTEIAQWKAGQAAATVPRPAPASPSRAEIAPGARPAPASASTATASQQRAIMNNLRTIASALKQFHREHGRAPASIHDLVGADKYIKHLAPVDGEDYSQLALVPGQPLTLATPHGVSVTFDLDGIQTTKVPPRPPLPPHIQEMQRRAEAAFKRASDAFQTAHPGATLKDDEEGLRMLLPYFATPQEAADFLEVFEAQKARRQGR